MKTISKLTSIWGRAYIVLMLTMLSGQSLAATLVLPSRGDVVGQVYHVTARSGDTLFSIGRRHDIGYDQMVDANRGLSATGKISGGTQVLVPGQFILPPVPRKGIVINLAELRLYYYPAGRNVVITKPIGIGREDGWNTPIGNTKVVAKEKDPIWRPTANVRAYAASHGTPIPEVFPPGPDNPMGSRVMRLGWPSYAIHGTNLPESVGGRVSAGCIRMMPEDVEEIYDLVPIGTQVTVVNEPFKAGWHEGQLYFEAHRPLKEQTEKYRVNMASVVNTVHHKTAGRESLVSWVAVKQATNRVTGIPEVISIR